LHGKIVGLLDLSLKGVQIVMGNLYALNISARRTNEVMVMVVGMKEFVTFHTVEDIDLGEDLVVRKEVELSVDRGFVHRRMPLRDLFKKLWRRYRLACRDKGLDHCLTDLCDAEALSA
jgi:hypothetical protein